MGASRVASAGVLLAAFALAGCGTNPETVETVEGLAHAVPGWRDDAVLAHQLENLNGGKQRVPPSVAHQFLAEDGLVAEIRDGTDESMGYACQAWDKGEHFVDALDPVAQDDLNRIWAAVSNGKVNGKAIGFACQVHELKDNLEGF